MGIRGPRACCRVIDCFLHDRFLEKVFLDRRTLYLSPGRGSFVSAYDDRLRRQVYECASSVFYFGMAVDPGIWRYGAIASLIHDAWGVCRMLRNVEHPAA